MTARVVLACDGETNAGPCRQATPVGPVLTGREARKVAGRDGWTHRLGADQRPVDLCPACTRRRQEQARPAVACRPVCGACWGYYEPDPAHTPAEAVAAHRAICPWLLERRTVRGQTVR